jgi:hypothetical protein
MPATTATCQRSGTFRSNVETRNLCHNRSGAECATVHRVLRSAVRNPLSESGEDALVMQRTSGGKSDSCDKGAPGRLVRLAR